MVRSIQRDPFKLIYFLEEELGKITPQNQLFNQTHRNQIMSYLSYLAPPDSNSKGTSVSMRSTNVDINGENPFGLTFVSGYMPDFEAIDKEDGKRQALFLSRPAVIFMPNEYFKFGEFIILEDMFAHYLGQFYTAFDIYLRMEDDNVFTLQNGRLTIVNKEDHTMMEQHKFLKSVRFFFEHLLRYTDCGNFKQHAYPAASFRGAPQFAAFYNQNAILRQEKQRCFDRFMIPMHETIMLAAIKRLMRTFYPGLLEHAYGFDEEIMRRFLAQYFYMSLDLNQPFQLSTFGVEMTKRNIETIIQAVADSQGLMINTFEDVDFQKSSLCMKYLYYKHMCDDAENINEDDIDYDPKCAISEAALKGANANGNRPADDDDED